MSPLIELALAAHRCGYEVVACHGKAPIFREWQHGAHTVAEIEGWDGNDRITNIGIRTGTVIGLDLDITDAGLSERAKNLALQVLGDTSLVRIGRQPRQLLVYRIASPIRKKIATGVINGITHKVEVLAAGQQFVAYGRHPDTLQPYVWLEADLARTPLSAVREVTEAALDAYIAALADIIGPPPRPKPAPGPVPSPLRANGHDTGVDAAEVLDALYAIPGSLEYDEWVRVGMALYSALGPAGEAHWMAWSARSPKNQVAVTIGRWRSFHQVRDIHAETLFYIALDNGWKPAKAGAPVSELGIFKGRKFADAPNPETGEFEQETGSDFEDEFATSPGAGERQEAPPPPPPGLAFTLYTRIDPGKIPARRFVYGRHYIRQFLSTDISPGGIGKSSLVIAEAVAMVAHKDLLGYLPTERIKVAYWNGEDPLEELQRRVEAVCLHYGITPEETNGRLFIDSGRLLPLILAYEHRKGVVLDQAVIDAIIASIRASGIDVLIIDPFISSHRVGENDNNAIELVAKAWSHIADVTGCAVNLVHHSRKLNGEEVTVESGRGASALLAACRSARTLNQMTKDESAQLNVEQHRLYFRVDDGKSNLQPPADGATWHRLVNVDLPNGPMGTTGDKVGVVTRWEKPDPMGNLTARDLLAVQNAVAKTRCRLNTQARDWVGKVVAQVLGLSLPEETSRVKYLIAAWLKSGALTIVEGLDSKRTPRDFVEVGNWVEVDE